MHFEMVDVEATLLREIPDRRITQKSLAVTYAFGLVGSEQVNWARVNRAILDHRSMAALTNIKTLAWKHVDQREAQAASQAIALGQEQRDA